MRVFLSVAGPDRPWARWIGQELRRAGYQVEYDEWSWPAGSSFLDRMEEALGRADRVLAVVSPAYLTRSTYGREEREAAQRLAHSRDGLLVPVLVAACELPPLLGRLSHVSLVGLDEAGAREAVLVAVRGPRLPGLTEQMPFPGPTRTGRAPEPSAAAGSAAPFPGEVAGAGAAPARTVTVLHLSDLQFGAQHLFGGNGLIPADSAYETLVTRLGDDLDRLRTDEGLVPDLIIVTGDLAETGRRAEFDRVLACLGGLAERLGLPRDRVAIVPGNHDINRARCVSYFMACEGDDEDPVPPYWPKWQPFERMFNAFYDGVDGATFAVGQPWSLFVMADVKVVVAGLNSTMAESHRDDDHYGWVGESQARWFAEKLAAYERDGWLRIGAVHHNLCWGAVCDDENLFDVDDLDRVLGPKLHLVMHGHTHTTSTDYLGISGVPVLSTGSAAVHADARPAEVPNQYQLLRIDDAGFTRHLRMYVPSQRCWVGDTRASSAGLDSPSRLDRRWVNAGAALPPPTGKNPGGGEPFLDVLLDGSSMPYRVRATLERMVREMPPGEGDTFLDRVAEVAKLRHEKAEVRRIDGAAGTPTYLRLTCREDATVTQHPVGVFEGCPARADVDAFATNVHSGYAASDRTLVSDLVYGGPQADEGLRRYARGRGVRLVSFVEYQGLLDLGRYVRGQTARLAKDALYPPSLYLPQRYRRVTPGGDDGSVEDDALGRLADWLSADEARFVLLLGDFGRGKTFLLRELARTLPERLPNLVPLLVELRSLEKSHGVDELVATHLLGAGEESFDARRFRYMLRSGRVVLLFDGFDELALRVTYERAADHLGTLLAAVEGKAKIVLSSRGQHFRSDRQVLTKLGERVETLAASRVATLEDFTEAQMAEFLTRLYGGDAGQAEARLHLIHEIKDLLGLAHNPRMLGFIAALDEQRLRAVQARTGTISSADLYAELVTTWLAGEERRRHPRGSARSLAAGELRAAVTALALRLWEAPERGIGLAELTDAARGALAAMTATAVGMEVGEAAQQVGSGSLLVRTAEDTFAFIHSSVMEYLVAAAVAATVVGPGGGDGSGVDVLAARPMSPLMVDFYCGAAGLPRALSWARQVLADADATQPARRNALAIALHHDRKLPRRARLAGTSLSGVDLRGLDLSGADLTGADLSDARMVGTDLSGATLRGARLGGVGFERARLAGADLREAVLARTNLGYADLTRADLTGADLTDTRMIGTNLTDAVLRHSRFVGATLRDAMVAGADLAGADLTGARIIDSDLARVTLTGSDWTRAAIVTRGGLDDTIIAAPELAKAAIPGRDPVVPTVGPSGPVYSVAFSLDGALLAYVAGNVIIISDLRTGEPVGMLSGHTGGVRSVVFSPDGTRLASAGNDGAVRLWAAATGEPTVTLTGHTGGARSLAFSPDGRRLATGGADRVVRLWDAVSGRPTVSLSGSTGTVLSVVFSSDGTRLASASNDGAVRLWNAATGRPASELTGPTGGVLSLVFSPDGTRLASASNDGAVRLWDVTSGQPTGHTRGVWPVAFSSDGAQLVSAWDDGTVRLWDAVSGQPAMILSISTGTVLSVAFSPDSTRLATGGADGAVRLWDATTGQPIGELTGPTGRALSVAFSPAGTRLAIAGHRVTRLWDAIAGRPTMTLAGSTGTVLSVAYSPDGTRLATACADGAVRLWDATSGQPIGELTGPTGTVLSVVFSPDGTRLATTCHDGPARVWDIATGRLTVYVTGHTDWVRSVAFSSDGTRLATGGADGVVRLWDATTGQPVGELTSPSGTVLSVAFSPDGVRLASAGADGMVRLWDATTGQPTPTLIGYTNMVRSVVFSPDGARLATSGGDDGVVRLWDAATGTLTADIIGHTDWVRSVAFSPDGTRLVTGGGDDGTVRLWDTATGRQLATLIGTRGGWAVLFPDGSYKFEGEAAGAFWWAVKLCRFEPGELDPYVPEEIRRLPTDAPIPTSGAHRNPASAPVDDRSHAPPRP